MNKVKVRYFEINEGDVLLRSQEDATRLNFRLMCAGTNGKWVDGGEIGWRYAIICSEPDGISISEIQAKSIAERLGGTLADDGGLAPVDANGTVKQLLG